MMDREMMDREDFFAQWSKLHGGAEIKGIVRWWLRWAFQISRSLARLRFTANGLTLAGLLLGTGLIATLADARSSQSEWIAVAIVILVLSLIADGVDGSLALITSSASRFGAAFDAIVDRLVESLWALALVMIGADHLIVLIAWLTAQTQEYIRARIGGLGVTEIGVVTPAERPVRASFLFVALLVTFIYSFIESSEILGFANDEVISLIALLWLALQAISLVMVAKFATKALQP